MIKYLKETLARYERAKTIKLLCSVDPERLEQFGIKGVFPAFRRAATKVPAYKKILQDHHVDYRAITDIEQFKKTVPLIDKNSLFPKFEIEDLCVGGRLEDMKSAMSSSGFSGVFSFGINTPRNYRDTARSIDTALEYTFGIDRKKTFLVNCVPMGVKVTSSLRLTETSVRADMALALIKKFSPKFDQTIIVSDPHFIKKIVEDGIQEGIDWKKINVSLIFGEDWFSDSFRCYMAHLIGMDVNNPQGRFVGATMGIAELDLNLFHESVHSARIRHLAQQDAAVRKLLFGGDEKISPILFHYYPHRIFLESIGPTEKDKELVFTMLSPHMLVPLIRYNSKDRGSVIGYNKLKKILINTGHADLVPELKLPLVWVAGRNDRFLEVRNNRIYPEEIKQGLYEDFQVASETTGYFRLNKEKQILEIQLLPGILVTDELKLRFAKALFKYCETDLPLIIYPYQQFPYSMVLDYERKFLHIK
ncbi:MAG: hypothetical protein HQL23_05665 [Candidatus Omnitrophica bacterium]|nr:hypothetical protein [Candidatus Omnitrophota bacterium]